MEFSFEQSMEGVTVSLDLRRQTACGSCGGSGWDSSSKEGPCSLCGGTGQNRFQQSAINFATPCGSCAGTGKSRPACKTCAGKGTTGAVEKVRVAIPPGVDNGSTVRVAGKGNAGLHSGPAGDLLLMIRVKSHPWYERKGINLFLDLPLTFEEAALGAKVQVPTPAGKATIRIPPGTQPGQRFRLSGRGVPRGKGGSRGDLFAIVRLTIPKVIEESSKALLEEFFRKNPQDPRAQFQSEES